eukprot:TRINITY_DN49317_c0_g2_i1.p1 TRINITY_DN49317_c0_g2~~TRINITY_DN49317_c0_g2_i1.p1  ORF type:complete len:375 (-),score=50.23 TRINITY_DN49317_c0_g2_i1:16-1140(-)
MRGDASHSHPICRDESGRMGSLDGIAVMDSTEGREQRGRAPQLVWSFVLLSTGVFLHPELKLLYAQGKAYGKAKNTVSVVDTLLAVLVLAVLRCIRPLWLKRDARVYSRIPTLTIVQHTMMPGLCIFGAIALATWANYESLWTFFVLAPMEILFVSLLSCVWQKVVPSPLQMLAISIVVSGAIVLTVAKKPKQMTPAHGWPIAVFAALLFRFNQALATITVRNACVALRDKGVGVLDISLFKLAWACAFCAVYALATEGLPAWQTLLTAQGEALWLLILSVVLTCVFQTANVGLNSHFKSIPASIVMQLQPPVQILVAIALSGTDLAESLKLKWDSSVPNLIGLGLLLLGAALYLVAPPRREPMVSLASLEDYS